MERPELGGGAIIEWKRPAIGKTWRGLKRIHARLIRDLATDAERPVLIERIDQALTIVIVVDTRASPDGSLWVRRESDGKARSDIILRLRPVARLSISRARGSKLQVGLVDHSFLCCCLALHEPGVRIDRWSNLLARGLVGCLQDGVAYAEGESQVGPCAPGILQVILELIRLEVAIEERALLQIF